MQESGRQPLHIDLTTIVLVGLTGGFVTALIGFTGQLMTLWPLYVVPIVIAALAYHIAGAILISAVCSALLTLLFYSLGLDPSALSELVVGMGAFTVSGIVIGAQSSRSAHHRRLLEEASVLDPTTGVFKRAYFEEKLHEELRRAERYELECSVVLVRIECFDEFKNQFGHYKAEMLLEHLADILRVSIRDHDIVARYDGVTFAIGLPFAGDDAARAVAERLRKVVNRTEFEGDVLEPVTHCTVRTSHAVCPGDACEFDRLLDIVETRLEGASR